MMMIRLMVLKVDREVGTFFREGNRVQQGRQRKREFCKEGRKR